MNINQLKALHRIRCSDDGESLIEYLEEVSKNNYKQLKMSEPEYHSIYIGRAQMIDEIKDFILSIHEKIKDSVKDDPSEWSL